MTSRQLQITWPCPGCRDVIRVARRTAGVQITCPKCATQQIVPRDAANFPATSASLVAAATPATRAPGLRTVPPRRQPPAPLNGRSGWLLARFSRRTPVAEAAATAIVMLLVAVVVSRRPLTESLRPTDDAYEPRQGPVKPAASNIGPGASVLEVALAPPHSADELMSGLLLLEDAMEQTVRGEPAAEQRAALLRLRMYRFLCGVPEQDLVIDDRLSEESRAAADICRQLNRLTHTPANPGLPEDAYRRACSGAASGNLASGFGSLVLAVDGWMDDSDAANIDALGHRRWCLNPSLQRVGFGRTEGWCVMWAHDTSGSESFRLPAVCYPPPGQVPSDMFKPRHAWSVTLNPRIFGRPRPGEIHVRMRDSRGIDLTLDKENVETSGYGIDNCIIFRPRDLMTTEGSRYDVRIEGVHDHDNHPRALVFTVEFVAPRRDAPRDTRQRYNPATPSASPSARP
jgi:hypothetical protein